MYRFYYFACFLLLTGGSLSAQTQLGSDIRADLAPGGLGTALALSQDGNRLLIGDDFYSPGNDIQRGLIQLWEWDGNDWGKVGAPVVGDDNFDKIGETLTLSADGSRFAYGLGGSGFSTGFARVYALTNGEWSLLGDEFVGADSERLGTGISLSADGQLLALGAPATSFSSVSPSAKVYAWDGNTWTLRGNLIPDPIGNSPQFGAAVLLSDDGNRLLVANNINTITTAQVFTYDWNGTDWVLAGTAVSGQSDGDGFGRTLALSQDGNRLAVGAAGYDISSNSNEGFAEVYDWTAAGWVRIGETLYGNAQRRTGTSVALSDDGSVLAVGSIGDINTSGLVGVYSVDANTGLNLEYNVEETDGSALTGRELGAAVALSGSGDRLAAGEPNYFDNALNSNTGRVRVFDTGFVNTRTLPQLDLVMLPNPTSDRLRLSDGGAAVWTVSDVLGRTKLRHSGEQLSLARLPAGNYVVRAVRKEGQLVRVIIKD